jgi:hypothetical protein
MRTYDIVRNIYHIVSTSLLLPPFFVLLASLVVSVRHTSDQSPSFPPNLHLPPPQKKHDDDDGVIVRPRHGPEADDGAPEDRIHSQSGGCERRRRRRRWGNCCHDEEPSISIVEIVIVVVVIVVVVIVVVVIVVVVIVVVVIVVVVIVVVRGGGAMGRGGNLSRCIVLLLDVVDVSFLRNATARHHRAAREGEGGEDGRRGRGTSGER